MVVRQENCQGFKKYFEHNRVDFAVIDMVGDSFDVVAQTIIDLKETQPNAKASVAYLEGMQPRKDMRQAFKNAQSKTPNNIGRADGYIEYGGPFVDTICGFAKGRKRLPAQRKQASAAM